ncbi:hypothetical protein GCM10010246_32540 [Streptomyces cuspidosporus]|uniref:Uncharacterized protein n=1 Tax=Streptomyces cuspidosporus TaxID=66882 RepID=A0ABN3G503_9ACTN
MEVHVAVQLPGLYDGAVDGAGDLVPHRGPCRGPRSSPRGGSYGRPRRPRRVAALPVPVIGPTASGP